MRCLRQRPRRGASRGARASGLALALAALSVGTRSAVAHPPRPPATSPAYAWYRPDGRRGTLREGRERTPRSPHERRVGAGALRGSCCPGPPAASSGSDELSGRRALAGPRRFLRVGECPAAADRYPDWAPVEDRFLAPPAPRERGPWP
jgi:hypothetical protein